MIYKIIVSIWFFISANMVLAGTFGYYEIGFFGVLLLMFCVFEMIGFNEVSEKEKQND